MSYHCVTESQHHYIFSLCKGAALTNPFDVIRNEMFKKNTPLVNTVRALHKELGWKFVARGVGKNIIAVAIPIACTIFFTDAFIQYNTTLERKTEFK